MPADSTHRLGAHHGVQNRLFGRLDRRLENRVQIVIYRGCRPWSHCPNMKPAMDTLKSLGFTKLKALMIETNMSKDWIQLGYPSEAGAGEN